MNIYKKFGNTYIKIKSSVCNPIIKHSNNKILYLLSIIAGSILPLAFAPFSIHPIEILSPAILLLIWQRLSSSAKQCFISGWLFGFGFFAGGASWVYASIYNYGHAPVELSFFITALFIAALALFISVHGYIFQKIKIKNNLLKNLLIFPATWVLISEWLRTWVLTGFPWLFLGYSQIDTSLKNIAPFLGVYGISFAVATISGALVSFVTLKNLSKRIWLLFAFVLFLFFCISLGHIHTTNIQGKAIPVSLIQGNIPIEMKWNEKRTQIILGNYKKWSSQNWKSRIIVWPEGAMPAVQSQIKNYLQKLEGTAKKHNTTIVSGVIYQPFTADAYYNSMIALGVDQGLYLKKHLVPFGEFLPFKQLLAWLLDFWHLPWSSLESGPMHQPDFILANLIVAPFICYEITYPEITLQYLPRAQFLLTITEDGWFGHSTAAAQHLEISRMRSLETGRYQLICANSGITAIVKPDGTIVAKAPTFQQTVLSGEIYAYTGATPWVQYGHYLWWILCCLCIGLGFILDVKRLP